MSFCFSIYFDSNIPRLHGPYKTYKSMENELKGLIKCFDYDGKIKKALEKDDFFGLMKSFDIHIFELSEVSFDEDSFKELYDSWKNELDKMYKEKGIATEKYERDVYERLKKKFG